MIDIMKKMITGYFILYVNDVVFHILVTKKNNTT